MARNSKVAKKTSSRKPRSAEGKGRLRRGRPKVCRFCSEQAVWVDYKDVNVLARFLNDRGRIRSRGSTGTCAQHQRDVAVAIKTARELALLPYSVRSMAADPGDRRGGARRGHDKAPSAQSEVAEGSESDVDAAGAEAVEGETEVEGLDGSQIDDGEAPEETSTVAAI